MGLVVNLGGKMDVTLYTTAEAVQVVGMTTHTYYYRRRRGDPIPRPSVRIGRREFFTTADLEALQRYYLVHRE